ncbi:ABC transporter ATP-binding protein [Arvimicrobium flavum]|uniref:ABC transporter ATP-binding protein n=1 Tax=Arvimicrobium flavum TaxID=3393320 RepID=UPI00237B1EE0|nr:ABC transporter ATP-binding protein [Mesorhizobium shangrilense]
MTQQNPKALKVEGLEKSYGAVRVVRDVSFEVEPGEFLSLLGPSGCGKTTTLRCIAGFERPDEGRILFGDTAVTDMAAGIFVPPNRRGFGMVFQSYAVWPHMTVADNVAYPLSVKGGIGRSEIAGRVGAVLELVGLGGLDKRYPNQLSGGQQQRVALARALIMKPGVLLFDEPLSNLDAKLRERMRFELIELQRKIGVPAVFVTHDQAEAMVISRRILVMDKGRIGQIGSPAEIYERPRSRYVADFVGLTNFFDVTVTGPAGHNRHTVSGSLGAMEASADDQPAAGERRALAVRPERVRMSNTAPDAPNVFEAELVSSYFLGPYSEYFLTVAGQTLRAQATERLAAEPGEALYVHMPPEDCLLLDVGE